MTVYDDFDRLRILVEDAEKFLTDELGGKVVPLEFSEGINILDTGIPFPLKDMIENSMKKAE